MKQIIYKVFSPLLPLTSCLLLFTSCEKEIDIDYHQVSQLYVAEGLVTQHGSTNRTNKPTYVRLTTTQDMTDNDQNAHNLTDATIVLSEDGYHFQSSSVMQAEPQFSSFRFVWKDVLTERMLFGDLKIDDIKGENNYYFMHIYRNGIGYRWAVMDDSHNPGGELQQLFSCTTERNLDESDDGLQDGDKIHVEIRSIDRRTYDYFYSMQVMQNSGTNPVENYTGGCLGYFSACYVVSFDTTFQRSEVETE